MQLTNTGQLQYIRLAQPVSGAQVVQGQIQTLANTQQVTAGETAPRQNLYIYIKKHAFVFVFFLHIVFYIVLRSRKQRSSRVSSSTSSLMDRYVV